MGIIHERVAKKGHLLDTFPGLGLKAYLVREREAGAPVNQYAPFYLWNTPEGMNSFLWGPGFQGIVNDFEPARGAALDGPVVRGGARVRCGAGRRDAPQNPARGGGPAGRGRGARGGPARA